MYLTDIHCHILHGVDDGARTVEDSLAVVRTQYEAGVRNIVVTPHYRPRMFETPRIEVADRFELLKRKVSEMFPDASLFLGAEYFMNSDVVRDVTDEPLFRINGGNRILIEFDENVGTNAVKNAVYDLRAHGFFPIIAHAERYANVASERSFETVNVVRNFGALIQVNAGSVIGKEGRRRRKFVKNLMERGLCDVVASDAHDVSERGVFLKEAADYVEKKYGIGTRNKLFSETPESILNN